MACPGVEEALRVCPFLARLAQEQGDSFARSFARNPLAPAAGAAGRRPIFEEEATSVDAVARLFHGPGSMVPLPRFGGGGEAGQPLQQQQQQLSLGQSLGLVRPAGEPCSSGGGSAGAALRAAGVASVGLSRAPRGTGGVGGDGGRNPSGGAAKAEAASSSGRCPLRALLPALGGLIALPAQMRCPAPICAVRSALARTGAVRRLRPKALGVKFGAVGAFTAAVNVPAGAWRENFEKFSPGWFLAVHLTIPVVGMLRKALAMPPPAILLTLAAAVAGQQLGAALERRRRARHCAFTAYSPELAASYGQCPVLPPLTETPANPEFALEMHRAGWEWELAALHPAAVGITSGAASAVAVASSLCRRASPLAMAVSVA